VRFSFSINYCLCSLLTRSAFDFLFSFSPWFETVDASMVAPSTEQHSSFCERMLEKRLLCFRLSFLCSILICFRGRWNHTTLHQAAWDRCGHPQQCICCHQYTVAISWPLCCTFASSYWSHSTVVLTWFLCSTVVWTWHLHLAIDWSLCWIDNLLLPSRSPNYGIYVISTSIVPPASTLRVSATQLVSGTAMLEHTWK
jgi:hypothetical protein